MKRVPTPSRSRLALLATLTPGDGSEGDSSVAELAPVRPLLIAIFGWIAEQERATIVARTNAGLERARRQGVRLGRPPRVIDVQQAQVLLEQGISLRQVAKRLRVPAMTLHGAIKRAGRTEKGSSERGS